MDEKRLQAWLDFFGWQGGTIHQVRAKLEKKIGRMIMADVSAHDLLVMPDEMMVDIQNIYREGL